MDSPHTNPEDRVLRRASATVTAANLPALVGMMRPGDIIVKWGNPGAVPWMITNYQEYLGYPRDACMATHVSLYVGGGEVIHAVYALGNASSSCVLRQGFEEYFTGTKISIVSPFGPLLDEVERAAVVGQAEERLGTAYSLRVIALTAFGDRAQWLWTRGKISKQAIREELQRGQICSTLVFESYLRALGNRTPLVRNGIISAHGPVVLPADFFLNPNLTDIAPRLP